ncbi:MAG: DNA ligase [Pseudomonadota bacterium]|uniref:DNA ligase n=1 Tax=Gallaecimonas pentaromativorans TaxID=584787 RepID=UPI00067F47A6|nr:DNA ligase [Gallaecimonas pentaromativorans]MED5525882.1 DNA ligase [Pseudomonadota bacterium]
MKTLLLALCLFIPPCFAKLPPLLANRYEGGIDVSQYLVSEKLDGVRGRWTGQRLLTKTGNPIQAPHWFTEALPPTALDGELWVRRGAFSEVAAVVLDREPDDAAWRQVHYMLFDMPDAQGRFVERLAVMTALVKATAKPWLQVIPQRQLASEDALMAWLEQVVAGGGEGLMLHRMDALYQHGRSDDLLKLKKADDMEGTVVAILPGQGKYQGMMGSLLLELDNGQRFRLGTGFTDAQRAQPPPVGARVTFSHHGFTKNGKPRFARFLRVRPDGA